MRTESQLRTRPRYHARPSCQPQHRRRERRAGARKASASPPETEENKSLCKSIGLDFLYIPVELNVEAKGSR